MLARYLCAFCVMRSSEPAASCMGTGCANGKSSFDVDIPISQGRDEVTDVVRQGGLSQSAMATEALEHNWMSVQAAHDLIIGKQ